MGNRLDPAMPQDGAQGTSQDLAERPTIPYALMEEIPPEWGRVKPFSLDAKEWPVITSGRQPLGAEVLSKYNILGELGRGGYGFVYLAEETELGRRVAIKVLAPHLALQPHHVRRFRREAQSTAQLRHPNIVSVYGTGESAGLPFIVMEYVKGRTLHSLIQGGPVGKEKALQIMRDLARALGHAHEHGVVHRDLKPGNVMVEDGTDRIVVMDFGLACQERSTDRMTAAGNVVGTPAYMSPEQARTASGRVDRRTDLYSLGVMFYEMVTGQLPFDGETPVDIFVKANTQNPTPPSKLNGAVSQDLEAVILRAMAKEAERRHQTAEELIRDIDRCLSHQTADDAAKATRPWHWGIASRRLKMSLSFRFSFR